MICQEQVVAVRSTEHLTRLTLRAEEQILGCMTFAEDIETAIVWTVEPRDSST